MFPALIKTEIKTPVFWVRVSAFVIPLAFLAYVLYINFLPFGYNKTFIINVGSENDTKTGEFYLKSSSDISERLIDEYGNMYRELNGTTFAVFKPKAMLTDAVVKISVEDQDIALEPIELDMDMETVAWNYAWDFSEQVPEEWKGNAFIFDEEVSFNGVDTKLEIPDSKEEFETGPFSLYIQWEPEDDTENAQQIVGHFNWEIWQNKDSVEFRVGRMNNAEGAAYSIKYPIDPEIFFNEIHSLVAVYNPDDKDGYIELYVDNVYAGKKYFGADQIYKNYGNENLSIGKSGHGIGSYFSGSIYTVNYVAENIIKPIKEMLLYVTSNDPINIEIVSALPAKFKQIKLNVVEE